MTADDVRAVGVVGSGTMGPGVAQTFAEGGYPVVLYNYSEEGLERGSTLIVSNQETLIAEGFLTRDAADSAVARIRMTTDFEALTETQYITENIPEDLELKREMFARLDALCDGDTVLATNTSGLSITDIAARATRHPERICGNHWWNPPHIVPLVEVIKGDRTSPETCEVSMALLRRAGKRPVLCRKDVKGFIANRLQHACTREAAWMYANGVASAKDIDEAMKAGYGFRTPIIGPFQTMDYNGIDIFHAVTSYMFAELSDARTRPAFLEEMVAQGRIGLKVGRGFYDYSGSDATELVRKRDRGLLRMLRLQRALEGAAPEGDEV